MKVSKVPESFYEKSKSEIDRLRKVDLTVQASYPEYSNVTISISQVKHDFPFGSGRFSILDVRLGFFSSFYTDRFLENSSKIQSSLLEFWQNKQIWISFPEIGLAYALEIEISKKYWM